MMTFSEYLLEYIIEKQMKWLTASKMCNVDRQQLKRYANGYAPKTIDTVENIADGLGMSKEEKEELCRLYLRQKMGEEKYLSEMFIHEIFCGATERNVSYDENEVVMGNWTKEQVTRINEKEQIYQLLRYLVQDVTHIKIKMNWSGKEKCLFSLFSGVNENTDIQQILEFRVGRKEDEAKIVMELEALIPYFQAVENYEVFCHYQWEQEEVIDKEGLNFIISDKGIVLFDNDMKTAMYANKQGYMEYYGDLFDRGLAKTNTFGGSTRDITGMFRNEVVCCLENKESKTVFRYQKSPKETVWITREGNERKSFYVEEMSLVHMFKKYMYNAGGLCV